MVRIAGDREGPVDLPALTRGRSVVHRRPDEGMAEVRFWPEHR
jgi:hypothetical protein